MRLASGGVGLVADARPRERAVVMARRMVRTGSPHRGSLGMGFLGVGAAVLVGIRFVYGLVWFVVDLPDYPVPGAAIAAWAVLLATGAGVVALGRVLGDRMPDAVFALFLAALGLAFALDLVAVWDLHDVGRYATASVSTGMALLLVLTLRGPRSVLIAASGLGVLLGAAMLADTTLTPATIPGQITTLGFAVLPSVVGVVALRGFRGLVSVELDRVLVQSTVQAPRFAVGMLASEKLAQLDLDAERLLDSVADGTTPLPLDAATAARAASLATELRLHLVDGRRETWLHHAVSESELLGAHMTVSDPSGLAGLLEAEQRDGLLSAVWLLLADVVAPSTTTVLHLTLGPAEPAGEVRRLRVPIVLRMTDVPRHRVDQAVWNALDKVGRYGGSSEDGGLLVRIDAIVERPVDVSSSSARETRTR